MKKSTKKLIFFLQTSAPEEPDSLLNCRCYWQWHEKAPGRKLFEGHFCQRGAGSSYEAYTERRPYSSKKQTKLAYAYDTRRRLTEITATNNSTAFMDYNLFYDDNNASYYSAVNNIFETVQQQHNHNGNVNGTLMSYDFSGASNAVSNFNGPTLYGYTYDQLNRLTLADATVKDYLVSGTNASASYQIGEERLTYDKIGNIETLKRVEKSTAGSNYTTVSTYSYTYAAGSNRLVNLNNSGAAQRTYTYDANGNLLTDSYKGITSSVYGRSAYVFNLVKNGEAISYLYSADDQRMYKKVTTTAQTTEEYYLTDAMGRMVAIKDLQSGDWEYYVSTNERDARLKPNTTNGVRFSEEEAQFFVYDHLGNTRITYTPMQVAGTYTINRIDYVADYFPYGKVLREFVYDEQERYLSTQHERDQETGLDYRGARYYDSDVARFLSVDALALLAVNWTTYRYALDNPVYYNDPNGMFEDNYYIYENGSIGFEKTEDKTDNFSYVKNDGTEIDLGTYEKMDNNLLYIPKGETDYLINRSKAAKRYINPLNFAGILGAAYEYYNETGLKVQINQLNKDNGGHSSHPGNGDFADIRYANKNGDVNESVWTNADNFDREKSQILANKFYKFGFNRAYGILTENAERNGPALENTYYVDGSKANPPYHHMHHMHLQHINADLIYILKEVPVILENYKTE